MEPWAALASAIIAALALGGAVIGWRAEQLRRSDVLEWTLRSIEAMQSIYLHCLSPDENDSKLRELANLRFRTSVLIEQGRLFFRNEAKEGFGIDKPPAYRGYRPCILDELLITYQAALEWPRRDSEDRLRISTLANEAVRRFVSLAQKEVGRSRTASSDTSEGGVGIDLLSMMPYVNDEQIEKARLLSASQVTTVQSGIG